jgi:hypothetical protein
MGWDSGDAERILRLQTDKIAAIAQHNFPLQMAACGAMQRETLFEIQVYGRQKCPQH